MILVSGATGRIGGQVVRTLRRLNLDVRALVRKGSEYFWLNDTGCRYFFGDLRDPASLARAMEGVRHVVMCANVRLERRDNDLEAVVARGSAALLEAARDAEIQRVVLVSCLGVGSPGQVAAFLARRRAEEQVQGSGLDYTILRASVHEGPFLELALRAHDGRRALLPGSGDNRLSPLASVDIGRMAAASLDLSTVLNRVVEVGGPVMSAREAYGLAAEALGAGARARSLPGPLLSLGCGLGRPVRRYANRLAELRRWFSEDLVASEEATAATFGLRLTPLAAAMREEGARMLQLRDPEEREKLTVHRQFYATIYEPGQAPLSQMPGGPGAPQR